MALEDLTGPNKFITALVNTNPLSADDRREGDDHIRGIKNVLHNTFPELDGAIPGTAVAINDALTAAESAVQRGGDTMTGQLFMPDGVQGAPALAFASEPTLGLYHAGVARLGVAGSLAASGDVIGRAVGLDAAVINSQDANYVYKAYAGANWVWWWNKATGKLEWRRGGGNPGTVFQANGDLAIGGNALTVGPEGGSFALTYGGAGGANAVWFNNTNDTRMTYNNANGILEYRVGGVQRFTIASGGDTYFAGGNFGISSATAYKPGGGPWTDSSDVRLKEHIEPFTRGLDAVCGLQPVSFAFKAATGRDPGVRYIRLIAQEAAKVFPELVKVAPGQLGGLAFDDLHTLDEGPVLWALVNAVKELNDHAQALHQRVAALEQLAAGA